MARLMTMLTGRAMANHSSQLGGLECTSDMTAMAKMFCGLEMGDVLHSGRRRCRPRAVRRATAQHSM